MAQYLMCPFPKLKVTQYHDGSVSHRGSDAWDITDGIAGSKSAYYAPCDIVCKSINTTYAFVWWESTEPVKFADGTTNYAVIMVGHDESPNAYVGLTIPQGAVMGHLGAAGNATGVHCHIEVAKGRYVGQWSANSYGVYCLQNSIRFYDAFYMNGVEVIQCEYADLFRYVSGGSDPDEPSTPDFYSKNAYLSLAEMQVNAKYICDKLIEDGWSLQAIAAMLGNMQTESTINPGIWQSLAVNVGPAYGLVQWDPYTKYTDWCEENNLEPSHMDSALARIKWEMENGEQYYPTEEYPLTFEEFKFSTSTPEYLAYVFLNNYERPADRNQPSRQTQARYWYDYLLDYIGSPQPTYKPRKRGFKWVLFNRNRRLYT